MGKIKEFFKEKDRIISYGQKGNQFGVKFLNYSLYERIEICVDIISGGLFSVKFDKLDKQQNK